MSAFFENNLILFLSSYVVAVIAWIFSSRLLSVRVRRAARASIIFFVFPIIYTGHPFLYYQCWMILLMYIAQLKYVSLFLFLGIWGIFVLVSQARVIAKQKAQE